MSLQNQMICFAIAFGLAAFTAHAEQKTTSQALPPEVPIPGAPTSECSFARADSNTPIRITAGEQQIPYQFACGFNRPAGVCAIATLPPGLVVMLGEEQNGWACVTGGDSTSGWIPAKDLAPVPANPQVPISEWLGWWRKEHEAPGVKNDRLLITREPGSKALHVSGRGYWYGLNGNVHFGSVQADATPIGVYLHAIEGVGGCVLDLKLYPAARTLQGYDNQDCGGMNVRFSGKWIHFTPAQTGRR